MSRSSCGSLVMNRFVNFRQSDFANWSRQSLVSEASIARLCLRASSFDCSASICAVRIFSMARALSIFVNSSEAYISVQDGYLNARLCKSHCEDAFAVRDMLCRENDLLIGNSLGVYEGFWHAPSMLTRVLTPLLYPYLPIIGIVDRAQPITRSVSI
jgi:hypothetical protein